MNPSPPLPRRQFLALLTAVLFLAIPAWAGAGTPWGREYFPNVTLTTHDGEQVRFFDDLIEGRIVVINFIYTSCPDTCPLETAQLVKVQEILGDRLGRDVFFYSITLDPKVDTPAVLKEYREKFHARWTFLTGEIDDVWELQKKLGLFLEEIRDGLNNHNVNMIIGNQATGRWMKRSPHENPHVLADQIGNWLDGWKRPPGLDNYENAPKLRDLPRGEQLFRTRCASCHTVVGRDPEVALGPDLLGVTLRRERAWLLDWLRAPDRMLADRDPIAMALFERYNRLAMPNLRLNREEAIDLLTYLESETERLLGKPLPATADAKTQPAPLHPDSPPESFDSILAVSEGWIRRSHPASKANTAFLTLLNPTGDPVTLTGVESAACEQVEFCEMKKEDGFMKRRPLTELVIPPGVPVELAPGGVHLLLKGRREPWPAGRSVALTLSFDSGRRQQVTLEVSDR